MKSIEYKRAVIILGMIIAIANASVVGYFNSNDITISQNSQQMKNQEPVPEPEKRPTPKPPTPSPPPRPKPTPKPGS